MNRFRLRYAALILALLLSQQWQSVAHASQHVDDFTHAADCVLCLHADRLQSAPASSPPLLALLLVVHEAPGFPLPVLVSALQPKAPHIRGPPAKS